MAPQTSLPSTPKVKEILEVFTWSGEPPTQAPRDMARAGIMVGNVWYPGFLCYGIPVGTREYCQNMLKEKVK